MECGICYEQTDNKTDCGHSFCKECLREWEDVSGMSTCPMCRTLLQSESYIEVLSEHAQLYREFRIHVQDIYWDLLSREPARIQHCLSHINCLESHSMRLDLLEQLNEEFFRTATDIKDEDT